MAEPSSPSSAPTTSQSPAASARPFRLETNGPAGLGLPTALELAKLAKTCQSKFEFVRRATNPLITSGQLVTIWYLAKTESGKDLQVISLWDDDSKRLWAVVEPELPDALKQISANGKTVAVRLQALPDHVVRVTAIATQADNVEYLCALSLNRTNPLVQESWLNAVAAGVQHWDAIKTVETILGQNEMLAQWIGVSQSILSSSDQRTSLFLAASGIRKILGAGQVAIALCDSDRSNRRIVALSDVESFDATSPFIKQIELAACLPLEGDGACTWCNATNEANPQPTLRDYSVAAGHEACYAARIQAQDGTVVGSILIGGSEVALTQPQRQSQIARLIGYLAENLAASLAAHLPLSQRLVQTVRRTIRHRWMKIAAWIVGGCAMAMLLPLPYRIHCDCQLQPMTRRFVSAPFEGVLAESLVRPGDLVQQGQVLARLDGRALRMKLSGLEAQKSGEAKHHKSALAQGNIAESQMALAEGKRLDAEIEVCNSRLNELNICSPIAGMIVNGDLDKVQGARLEMGQSLFEVAPLDQMRAEVAIPESEIRFVRPELSSRILLNAYPYQSWTAPIQSVRPRTEIRDDESVFIAEVVFENEQNQMRPGMKGQARVKSDFRLLGWILFHRAWETVRRAFYW